MKTLMIEMEEQELFNTYGGESENETSKGTGTIIIDENGNIVLMHHL